MGSTQLPFCEIRPFWHFQMPMVD